MQTKLKCILLVDDNAADNYLHRLEIEEAGVAERVVTATSGYEALDFLQTETETGYPQPDIIFLDINMPGMNGWEFLEEYEELPANQKAGVVIVMLTTSLNPIDKKRATENGLIDRFESKPLTKDRLLEIINVRFPS